MTALGAYPPDIGMHQAGMDVHPLVPCYTRSAATLRRFAGASTPINRGHVDQSRWDQVVA